MNITGDQVVQNLANYAASLGVDQSDFLDGMQYGNQYDYGISITMNKSHSLATRVNWKYATTRYSIFQTISEGK